jgi:hypothetical protein
VSFVEAAEEWLRYVESPILTGILVSRGDAGLGGVVVVGPTRELHPAIASGIEQLCAGPRRTAGRHAT